MTITVRHTQVEDAAALHHLYSQPAVYRDTLQLPYPNVARWEERLRNPAPDSCSLVALLEGEIVGQLTLFQQTHARRRHVATFGMGVLPTCHGRGVGSALLGAAVELCDNWLNVQRMELTVYTDNRAALALYRKFGFEVEGTSPCFAVRDGQMVDAHHMGRVRHA